MLTNEEILKEALDKFDHKLNTISKNIKMTNDLKKQCINAMAIQILRYNAGFGPNDPASKDWAEKFFFEYLEAPHLGDCSKAEH